MIHSPSTSILQISEVTDLGMIAAVKLSKYLHLNDFDYWGVSSSVLVSSISSFVSKLLSLRGSAGTLRSCSGAFSVDI